MGKQILGTFVYSSCLRFYPITLWNLAQVLKWLLVLEKFDADKSGTTIFIFYQMIFE